MKHKKVRMKKWMDHKVDPSLSMKNEKTSAFGVVGNPAQAHLSTPR
jgi:hypothetical protein